MVMLKHKRILFSILLVASVLMGWYSYWLLWREPVWTPGKLAPSLVQNAKTDELRVVSELEVPAKLVMRMEMGEPSQSNKSVTSLSLNQPSDMVSIGDSFLVLDAGNGRLVEVDRAGKAIRALEITASERTVLSLPMAMATVGGSIYIADSGAHRVLVARAGEGKLEVQRSLELSKIAGDTETPRPIGIAVSSGGDIYISDANNQRVLKSKADGTWTSFVGTGKRDAGDYGLNSPGGLAFDREGNLYVVDILNSRVMKYSPDGKFLLTIGQAGDTAGSFTRPKGVAVDGRGNVYVSDSLQAAVQVFDAQGRYVGVIGRKEPGNKDSDSLFIAPAEVKVMDRLLCVTDRLAGPFVFELQG